MQKCDLRSYFSIFSIASKMFYEDNGNEPIDFVFILYPNLVINNHT